MESTCLTFHLSQMVVHGNNFSHQDCPRDELWVDQGGYLKESGENLEIFIPSVPISEVFCFPRSCRKRLSLRGAHQGLSPPVL